MNPAFETTQWTLILEAAKQETRDGMLALETLCRRYLPPLLAYARNFGLREHDAEDVTQAFFQHLVQKNLAARAVPEHGRFRNFLLVSLRNFIHVTHRNATTWRRGGEAGTHLNLDEEVEAMQPATTPDDSATLAFDRQWAHTLIEIAMEELSKEQAERGTLERFAVMKPLLLDPDHREKVFAELQKRFGMADGAARTCLSRLRTRFRELVRQEVERVVQNPTEVDAEMAYLLRVLS